MTGPAASPVSVVLVDDQDLVRAGLDMMLAGLDDVAVVGQAADGLEAVRVVEETRPDVVLMDVRMPGIDGIEATRRIRAAAVDELPRVVILTTFDLDEYVFAAFRAGASGFLLKDAPRERILEAVRRAADGDALVAPSVTRRLIEHFVSPQPSRAVPVPGLDELTPREAEVLELIGRGLSNRELAERLVVSEKTVKTHVGRILAKLGLRDRVQAVILAYEAGIVRPGTLVYNTYISALTQRVTERDVLPISADVLETDEQERADDALRGDFIFEPEPEEILARLLPVYLETQIYRALLESTASEQGARMTAMRNASKNAGELIDSLTLSMNRARQAEITQEILEVVAGAEALV